MLINDGKIVHGHLANEIKVKEEENDKFKICDASSKLYERNA